MFSIIANVFGSWNVAASSLSRDEANELCDSIVIESHDGEAVIVRNETAVEISGMDCSEEWNFEFFNPPLEGLVPLQ